MLANKDLQTEIAEINAVSNQTKDVFEKALLKGVTLILKLLQSIRTNQVLSLRKQGIELIKPVKPTITDIILPVKDAPSTKK